MFTLEAMYVELKDSKGLSLWVRVFKIYRRVLRPP